MAIQLGTIVEVTPETGVVVAVESGDRLRLESELLQTINAPAVSRGDRVRLVLNDGKVTKLVNLGPAKALPTAGSTSAATQPERISARVTKSDPRGRKLVLQAGSDSYTFSPEGLDDSEWQRLQPGKSIIVLRWPDGRMKVELSARATPAPPRSSTALERSPLNWQAGHVRTLGTYHGLVESDDGKRCSFVVAQFSALSLSVNDRVHYCANDLTDTIVEMTVLEKAAPGSGWEDPCAIPASERLKGSTRRSIHKLIDHWCAERRLSWYWVVPGQEPIAEPAGQLLKPEVIHALSATLADRSFSELFRHQAKAWQALQRGQHVIVLTPTASGKTNCYNPAVFSAIADDPSTRALYVFPLNALLTDQLSKLETMSAAMHEVGVDVTVGKLIGGIGQEKRDQVKDQPPNILATNPEMLSWLLNAQESGRLRSFFAQLRFVILDEAHSYRSVLGMHAAALIRRLLLACRRAGNPGPQFILSSATVGDAESLAQTLTSQSIEQFEFIWEADNGAKQPLRHWVMLEPADGDAMNAHLAQAAEALVDALTLPSKDDELQVILFVRSYREMRYVDRSVKALLRDRGRADLLDKVATYAGGLLDQNRKTEIYDQLRSGALRAVIATTALEAGIDLGNLDVCILAGFPYHAMRMRQMAGRAGRRNEGMLIYVPDLSRSVDRYYTERPTRLLTQPPEAFVIDADNPYIARRHLVTAAATMSGGISEREATAFGKHTGRIITEALEARALQRVEQFYTAKRPTSGSKWQVDRIRGNEQDPYALCKAPKEHRCCVDQKCLEASLKQDAGEKCEHLVQLLDRQYVYREAHPGAIFEDVDGRSFYRCVGLDEENKLVFVEPIGDTRTRTFPVEHVTVFIQKELGRRDLPGGAQLVWGEVRVTRDFAGYGQYELIPRRRCRRCNTSVAETVRQCPQCGGSTRPFFDRSKPDYFDYPAPYSGRAFTLRIDTIACWLVLPPELEASLKAVARCPIRGPGNRVAEYLRTDPPFRDAADLSRVTGMSMPAAQVALDYTRRWAPVVQAKPPAKDQVLVLPDSYGQCLCHDLRARLPEDEALSAFELATGYPATKDAQHICRKCFGGVLLTAAHTLEHIVALNYPLIALGASEDIGSTTAVLHPQTSQTTVFWYDAYDGGIGAAEKVYAQFEALILKSHNSLGCKCARDEGCPVCTELAKCDRGNRALSKLAAIGLAEAMLGRSEYISTTPVYVSDKDALFLSRQAAEAERARGPVTRPGSTEPPPDPLQLLRVQPYVHDVVLEQALEVRAEEASQESPPVSIAELARAHAEIKRRSRPETWSFDPDRSPHETLHLQPTASRRLARVAYLAIVKAIHPDHNDQAWATAATQSVNAAWEAIKQEREGQ